MYLHDKELRAEIGSELSDKLWVKHLNKLYSTWQHVKGRCYNENDKRYKRYGGRGIQMAEEWKNDFTQFCRDLGLPPAPTGEYSIERRNGNGNYAPDNCEWADPVQQANNRSTSRKVTWRDRTHTVAEWEGMTGLKSTVLVSRLNSGWSPAEALTFPSLPPAAAKVHKNAQEYRDSEEFLKNAY